MIPSCNIITRSTPLIMDKHQSHKSINTPSSVAHHNGSIPVTSCTSLCLSQTGRQRGIHLLFRSTVTAGSQYRCECVRVCQQGTRLVLPPAPAPALQVFPRALASFTSPPRLQESAPGFRTRAAKKPSVVKSGLFPPGSYFVHLFPTRCTILTQILSYGN